MAPTAISPPYFKSDELKHTDIILSLACMIKSEEPRATQGRIIFAYSLRFSGFILRKVFLPNKKLKTHIHDKVCEIIVASAAPRTPIFIPNINTGSRTIFATAPIKTDNMPVFANPCAVINAFMPSVSCTNIVPMA